MLWWALLACTSPGKDDETEPAALGCYEDLDGDGFGTVEAGCEGKASDLPGDCDDFDALINPGAEEVWYDDIDQDCDGGSDFDADGDGQDATRFGGADCDDTNASAYDGAEEVCDDEVDNDCDTRADCGDDDCFSVGCDEDCADGWDNDLDGLTDCEDGECGSDPACQEVCDDGVDNDNDGLSDCVDDDCLGAFGCAHPDGVRVQVLGGTFNQEMYRGSGDWSGGSHSTIWRYNTMMYSVSGVVHVLPSSSARWSTAATSSSCAWRAETVRTRGFRSSWGLTTFRGYAPERSGVTVDSGCRLDGSDFLPVWLVGNIQGAGYATNYSSFFDFTDLWYPLQVSTSAHSVHNETWGWGEGEGRFQHRWDRAGTIGVNEVHTVGGE